MKESKRQTTKPRKRAIEPGTPVLVRLQPGPLKRLDDWRRKQPDLPGRAEAIRRLLASALGGS
jgi:hypothetical protein